MRGLATTPERSRPCMARPGERGLALPFVAISMVVLLGMASLTIDIGNGWRTRRGLIAATDASALAAAQDYASDLEGCDLSAGPFLLANDAAASYTCSPTFLTSDQGFVVVEASTNVQTWFAGVIGRGDYDVASVTAAAWGPPLAVTGLRPIGLCLNGSAVLQDIFNNPPATNTVVRVEYDKDHPDDCGGEMTPGNWGTIDFDGGANSNADTKDWVANGYPGEVQVDNHIVTSCAGEAHCYEGDTGALAGVTNELNGLRSSGAFFTIPVFNFVENPGGNAEFHLVGVLRTRLLAFKTNGQPEGRFFELLVEPGLITGTCCGSGGAAGGNRVIVICAVDRNAYLGCDA